MKFLCSFVTASVKPVAFLRGSAWIEIRVSLYPVCGKPSRILARECVDCKVFGFFSHTLVTLSSQLSYFPTDCANPQIEIKIFILPLLRHPLTIPSHQKRTANSRIPQLAVLLFPLIISINSIHSHQSDKTTAATPIPTNITPPNFVLNRYNSDGSSA